MLRHKVLRIDHPSIDRIAKFLERTHDHFKSLAFVVTLQVLDVLEQKRFGSMMFQHSDHIEEQRALRLTRKAMLSPQRVLLADPSKRKRLTRKPCNEHVVRRNVSRINVPDVSRNRAIVAIVRLICLPRKLVPLRREDAMTANALHRDPEPPDSRKQVNERKALGHVLVLFCSHHISPVAPGPGHLPLHVAHHAGKSLKEQHRELLPIPWPRSGVF